MLVVVYINKLMQGSKASKAVKFFVFIFDYHVKLLYKELLQR